LPFDEASGCTVAVAGVVATPTKPRGPGPRASWPGATASGWRRPGAQLGCQTAPVPRWHGAPRASSQHRAPSLCPSRYRRAAGSPSAGGDERAGPAPSLRRICPACAVRQGLDHRPGGGPTSELPARRGRSVQSPAVGRSRHARRRPPGALWGPASRVTRGPGASRPEPPSTRHPGRPTAVPGAWARADRQGAGPAARPCHGEAGARGRVRHARGGGRRVVGRAPAAVAWGAAGAEAVGRPRRRSPHPGAPTGGDAHLGGHPGRSRWGPRPAPRPRGLGARATRAPAGARDTAPHPGSAQGLRAMSHGPRPAHTPHGWPPRPAPQVPAGPERSAERSAPCEPAPLAPSVAANTPGERRTHDAGRQVAPSGRSWGWAGDPACIGLRAATRGTGEPGGWQTPADISSGRAPETRGASYPTSCMVVVGLGLERRVLGHHERPLFPTATRAKVDWRRRVYW
jgi:hypothetical protein